MEIKGVIENINLQTLGCQYLPQALIFSALSPRIFILRALFPLDLLILGYVPPALFTLLGHQFSKLYSSGCYKPPGSIHSTPSVGCYFLSLSFVHSDNNCLKPRAPRLNHYPKLLLIFGLCYFCIQDFFLLELFPLNSGLLFSGIVAPTILGG